MKRNFEHTHTNQTRVEMEELINTGSHVHGPTLGVESGE